MTECIGNDVIDEESCIYTARPGIVHTSVGGQFFIVTRTGFVEVNETALFFWKCMEHGTSRQELFDLAQSKYEIDDAEVLRSDIDMLIKMFLKKELISVNGGK